MQMRVTIVIERRDRAPIAHMIALRKKEGKEREKGEKKGKRNAGNHKGITRARARSLVARVIRVPRSRNGSGRYPCCRRERQKPTTTRRIERPHRTESAALHSRYEETTSR